MSRKNMFNKTFSNNFEAIKSKELYSKALIVMFLMMVSAIAVVLMVHAGTPATSAIPVTNIPNNQQATQLVRLPISTTGVVADNQFSQAVNPTDQVSIMISLGYQHVDQLNSFLSAIQDPHSGVYHHFLSKSSFIAMYSPKASVYNGLANYFGQFGLKVGKYNDRVAINLQGTFAQFEQVFHTQIKVFRQGSVSYFAPIRQLSVKNPLASYITGVSGLNNKWHATVNPMFTGSGSNELLYGTDLQNAYQLNQLYTKGYPTNLTIVTILWVGTDSSGSAVGPYYPSDINNYFSQVIPSNEPQPNVYADPIGGAPQPGVSSTKDTSQANYESTLDIEMAGSMAPGASIVEVYGPQATTSYLDQCFAEVLNPQSSAPAALQHTVVISNSWGGSDSSDSLWTSYEQQAAARGITVLASSGDTGTTTTPSFPATSAYNTYGTLAVGGTATVLSGTTSTDGTGTTGIQSQSVWYNTPASGDGSQSGVSSVYAEPSWQSGSSDANGVITAVRSGRGTADFAAVAANMEIYITSSSGSAGMTTLWGTSVACPLSAGQIAVMDYYMNSLEGFLAPTIYTLGQNQYNGQYTASTNPFSDVTTGSTGVYSTAVGYDLPTGWGSINSYNFVQAQTGGSATTYSVTFTESGLTSGTSWSVTLGGSTKSSTTSTITFTEPAGTYSYTVNSVSGYTVSPASGSLTVSTANVNQAVTFTQATTYTVSFTESGLTSGTSWSVTLGGSTQSSTTNTVSFSEVAGTYSYTVGAVSGYSAAPSSGSVTVSTANVNTAITYSVVTQSSGIYAQVTASSISTYSLNEAEQFNVGSSNEMVNFVTVYLGGSGSATVSIGSSLWGSDILAPQTVTIGSAGYYNVTFPAVTLTASTNYYLNVQSASGSPTWGYSSSPTTQLHATQDYWYSGSTLYNDNSYPNIFTVGYQAPAAPHYSVTFTESGLASGTSWTATLGGQTLSSTTSTITFSEVDGTYSYSIGAVTGYTVSPSSGSVTVNGANVNTAVTYTAVPTYSVTFSESGLPSGTSWSVTAGGSTKSSTTSSISFTEPDGTYSYTIGAVTGYTASPASGSVTVNGATVSQAVSFTQNTYTLSFTESGLPSGTSWSVTAGGSTQSSTTSTISFTEPDGSYSYSVGAISGYTASPSSGTATVSGANQNVAITFTSTTSTSATPYSYVTASSTSYYTLPEAEQFNVGSSSHSVNYISLDLSGSGSVTVSIGSSVWGTDVLPAQTINVVSGQTNYTVSFSSVSLAASTNYYLNVNLVSGSVQWAYTTSPTANVGATQDYWYSGSTLYNDNSYPNIYTVGYNTAGPAVVASATPTPTPTTSVLAITVNPRK